MIPDGENRSLYYQYAGVIEDIRGPLVSPAYGSASLEDFVKTITNFHANNQKLAIFDKLLATN